MKKLMIAAAVLGLLTAPAMASGSLGNCGPQTNKEAFNLKKPTPSKPRGGFNHKPSAPPTHKGNFNQSAKK